MAKGGYTVLVVTREGARLMNIKSLTEHLVVVRPHRTHPEWPPSPSVSTAEVVRCHRATQAPPHIFEEIGL